MATNCLGPFFLTRLLEGVLKDTAAAEARCGRETSTRIVWVSSMINANAPKGGVLFD